MLATKEEKHAACEKFVFRCPQTSKEIKSGCGVFTEKVGLRRGGRADLFFFIVSDPSLHLGTTS